MQGAGATLTQGGGEADHFLGEGQSVLPGQQLCLRSNWGHLVLRTWGDLVLGHGQGDQAHDCREYQWVVQGQLLLFVSVTLKANRRLDHIANSWTLPVFSLPQPLRWGRTATVWQTAIRPHRCSRPGPCRDGSRCLGGGWPSYNRTTQWR